MGFNWRDYIRVEEISQRYFDAEGKLLPQYEDLRSRFDSERINIRLTTAVLDQIAKIPEVQALMLDGFRMAQVRWQESHELSGDTIPEDKRIEISVISGARNAFNLSNTITLNPEDMVQLRYISQNHDSVPFSLQHAIIHELVHAADTRLTPRNELERRKGVAEQALTALLKDFPEYTSEYQETGTIAGIPAQRIFASRNFQEFDEQLYSLSMVSGIRKPFEGDNLKQEVLNYSSQYTDGFTPKEIISLYFQNAYKRINEANEYQVDELPAITTTNSIMGKYFGEPAREGYATVTEGLALSLLRDEDQLKFSELLLTHTFCQFKPDSGIAYTPDPNFNIGNLFAPLTAPSALAQDSAVKECKNPLNL